MGSISSLAFGFRNSGLGADDPMRLPVAGAQLFNATVGVAHSGMKLAADKAQNVLDKVDKLGTKVGVNDASKNIAKFASKAVNPLLVGAAGYRILKDDDKKSALIEETLAMGSMFGTEHAYKKFRNTVLESMGRDIAGKKTFSNDTKFGNLAQKMGNKVSKLPQGKQKLAFVLAELGFVGASIGAYTLGNILGRKVTGRDDKQQKNQTNPFSEVETANNAASNVHENAESATTA